MLEELLEFPVVAAAKDREGLEKAMASQAKVVFLLFGDICNLAGMVEQVKKSGKLVIVHLDLVDGFSHHEICVRFVKEFTQADGIISTKPNLIREAKQLGLISVQRIFLLDSRAFENASRSIPNMSADFIELLPGAMPKIIRRVAENATVPIIAGGMIYDKEDIISALSVGATAVSTTNPQFWEE